jgi:hypothetical protein
MNRQLLFPACACSALLCAALQASAADQSFDPRLEVGGSYDSNLRLVYPPLDDKVSGGYVDAAAIWSARTPLTDFSLQPRVRATRYSGSGESGTTNAYLASRLAHKLRRGRLGLAVDLSKQEVLTADLLRANGGDGLGTPGTDTAGLAFNNNKALFATVQPTGSFSLGARTQLLVDTRYTHVNYDSTQVQTLNDYTDVAGSVGLSLQATQRVRWVTNLTADRFTPATGTRDASSLGANVELWREQSQLTRAFVRLGAVRTQFSGSGSPSETNFNGGLGMQRNFTNGQVFLQANRRVDASGFGQAVVRDELNLRLNRNLSERVLVSASAVGIWTRPVATSSTLSKRRYYVASLGGEWRIRRSASIVTRVQYASRHNELQAGTPNSTSAYAGVVFEPHRRN